MDAEFASRLKAETGIDLSGLRQSIDTIQVRHTLKNHGEGREIHPEQLPVTADAISAYRRVVENYDKVTVRPKKTGTTLTFEKRVDGVVVVVQQIHKEVGELAFFDMWIKKAQR